MNLRDKLNPRDTALLIIDLQNDFCSPSGLMARKGKDVSRMDAMIDRTLQLASLCEQLNIPIFYTQHLYDRTKLTDLQKEQYDLDGKLVICDIQTDGHKFYRVNPPAERVFPKYVYNAFSNPSLAPALALQNVKTLIVTGVVTQVCVEATIRNGFDMGYKIIVPRDLVGTTSAHPDTQPSTLQRIEKTYGAVTDSTEISVILNSYQV